MRYLLCLCLLFAMTLPAMSSDIPYNGVQATERVLKLPEDGSKWYISIVGEKGNARYAEVLSWFENVPKLKKLQDQVQFAAIDTDSDIYTERYRPNVAGLPTVRVQDANGKVVYEAAGNKLPASGESLYNAIARAASGSEEWLPWRRNNKKPEPKPEPAPSPDTVPVPVPDESPDGGPPVFEPVDDLPV